MRYKSYPLWGQVSGLKHDEVFITNMVKCPKQTNEWGLQIQACLPQLEKEIQDVKPRLVVTLGSEVHKRFTTIYCPKRYQLTLESPIYRVWDHYPSSGGYGEYNGMIFFALIYPSNAVRLGKDIPDYLIPDLNKLKAFVEEARFKI